LASKSILFGFPSMTIAPLLLIPIPLRFFHGLAMLPLVGDVDVATTNGVLVRVTILDAK
jgi:hypothetical protein